MLSTESKIKFIPTTANKKPMIKEAVNSALPWPKGWCLSAGFAEIFVPTITATELAESVKECQASVIKATEPETMPAQYLIPNNKIERFMGPTNSDYSMIDYYYSRQFGVLKWFYRLSMIDDYSPVLLEMGDLKGVLLRDTGNTLILNVKKTGSQKFLRLIFFNGYDLRSVGKIFETVSYKTN